MKKSSRANKGQFSVIAALLVSVILVTAVISTYTMVRHAPIQDSPKVLTAIGEMNADIKQILDFTVGYYGSILTVTGNSTYARGLTTSYLSSGLVNIARSHPEWNPSFTLDFDDDEDISTRWFMPHSYSMGRINVTYSLEALGIYNVFFTTSSALSVEMLSSSDPNQTLINVTRDNSEPELGLSKENFRFYKYNYDKSTWDEPVNPDKVSISNGLYYITIPEDVNQDAYSVRVEDNRGIIVPAFYSQESVTSEIPHYTYTFNWTATGMLDIYESLSTDTFAIELLQNGTLKWLGQPLELTTEERPIPPVCIKAFRVNATIDGNSRQVPFQVEDWASNYMVPLGLSSSESIFSNTNMLVFLVNNEVENITVWWDGNDTATQTPYAWNNTYFVDDPDYASSYGLLNNSQLELYVHNFWIESKVVGESTSSTAEFLRVNGEEPTYGDQLAYVIYNGTVRDIVQQEAEYSGGVSDCPNFYTQIVLTLPANTTYYTYAVRTIFVDSSEVDEDRILNDLSALQLTVALGGPETGDCITEDGINATTGFPTPSYLEDAYNSTIEWAHHWSEFLNGTVGAGIMFTDSSNNELYRFDSIAEAETGALVVDRQDANTTGYIELNPVELAPAPFDTPLDVTWYGAIVVFDAEPIYRSSDEGGLWVMVEYPPSVTVN